MEQVENRGIKLRVRAFSLQPAVADKIEIINFGFGIYVIDI